MALDIQSNIPGMRANRNLYQATKTTNSALAKLSSGLKINQAKDDPSGLIISELLRSQISGYTRAIRNTQETNNVMSIAEGGLGSVSSMLTKMKGLAVHALNSGVTSGIQTQADQMEMNSLLSSINHIVSTTSYAGQNLLDGSKAFTFSATDPSGMINTAGTSIQDVSGTANASVELAFAGGASNQAEKAYLEADFGAATAAQEQKFTVSGSDGARTFTFAAGTSVEDMASAINSGADSTGVNAYAVRDQGSGATTLRLVSADYGSNAKVQVEQSSGAAFAAAGQTVADYGQDATVTVDGAAITTDGLTANVATGDLTATIALQAGSSGATTVAQTGYDQDTLVDANAARKATVSNISGGMNLQLGEGSGGQNRERVSMGNYNPATLGQVVVDGKTYSLNDLYGGGAASLANDPQLAMKIIDQAIKDVSSGRANIGAYQANALDTNADNLAVAVENITASESSIRDTDMAEMMTQLIKGQLLQQASLKGIQSSNMNSKNVLRLLGM